MTEMPIGILGGTFDPVHHGHLRLALEALDQAGLAEVRMVPLHSPSHRDTPVADGPQRRDMLELAMRDVATLALEECELERGGVSYTTDTLRLLDQRYPEQPLCLIVGMDAFCHLGSWREWPAIPELAHIIVASRPGEEMAIRDREVIRLYEQARTTDARALRDSKAGLILNISIPLLDISATRIRGMFSAGQDPRFLLPPAVLDFIHEQQIYITQPG